MILDDFVKQLPQLAGLIAGAFIVRVPWHLLPGKGANDDFTKETLPMQFLPADTDRGGISWVGLRLPYDHMVFLSEFNDASIIIVRSHKVGTDQQLNLDTTIIIRFNGGFGVKRFTYKTLVNGELGVPFSSNFDSALHGECVKIAGGLEVETLVSLGFDRTDIHRLYADYVVRNTTMNGRIGIEKDCSIYALMLSAVANLFACKNIVTQSHDPDVGIQQKRIRRGILPLYRYHTLIVRQSVSRGISLMGHGEPVALHWVRGHFKRYTEENKLFGQHIGLYWWQPHLAGTAPRIVDKDYALTSSGT